MPQNNFKFDVTNNPLIDSPYCSYQSTQSNPSPPANRNRVTNAMEKRITNVASDGRITNE